MNRPVPISPAPGQESVWAYPRPPKLERTPKRVQVWLGGVLIADTQRSSQQAFRVLETSHPPGYYLPQGAFSPGAVRRAGGSSLCEWKGAATYWTLTGGDGADKRIAQRAAWSYERPTPAFAELAGYLALYAAQMDECRVAGEVVTPQPGEFYGGWITADVVGPFKGVPGSMGW